MAETGAEPKLLMDLPVPKVPWRQRVKAVFTHPVKLPGWVAILWVAAQVIPDWKARYDFWLDVAKSSGGYLAMVAGAIASPYFTPSLLAAGLGWILFAGEAPKGVQRHHWLRYVGWAVISICITTIVVTAGYGALTFYIKQQVSQQDQNLQSRYAVGPVFWHLTEAQKIAFGHELSNVPESERFQVQILCLPDAGSRAFVEDISKVFEDAGWKANANCLFNKLKAEALGLYIGVTPTLIEKLKTMKSMDDWPHDLRIMIKALQDANISGQWASYEDDTKQDHFYLVVGNAPRNAP